MTDKRALSRRRLLAAVATAGGASVAGCGYQPAAGDQAWRVSIQTRPGLYRSPIAHWHADGERLYGISSNGWVSAYTPRGSLAWSGSPDATLEGETMVANGRVYMQVEDEQVVALEHDDDSDSSSSQYGSDAHTRWSAPLESADTDTDTDADSDADSSDEFPTLVAGHGLVVAARDHLVALAADDGTEQFVLEPTTFDDQRLELVAITDETVWVVAVPDDEPSDASDDSASSTTDPTLYSISTDGEIRATRSLAGVPSWLVAVDSSVALWIESDGGDVRLLDPDGSRRATVVSENSVAGIPIVVDDTRLYHYTQGQLEAIDTAAGERLWVESFDSFHEAPVADADGVYDVTGDPTTTDGCRLSARSSSGEPRWDVRPPTDLQCGDETYLVGDRLIVRADDELYGFRTTQGDRDSVRPW
ncbi:PQQ-binding-like beta-propeller repeat protein [Natronolimnobius sp. AArcel1]|uniref:outer membrane protein assembly factor BamB family protein n=1 Tax=Natronolimnobius sp. AArcel1 TaxID=1679093 RepID=UPI0013EC5FC2|nr:PQQ-binding-like beta-propeller repeat protein [Natronolimnobius sp. AArcel1]NGM68310.1 PQQ-binding-like beta-propeller repeat protein [Natronolimnobius sp. AArcel1]